MIAAAGGMFVAVVGPSGAGKDSILRDAKHRLSGRRDIVFARRVITRPLDAHEDHEPIARHLFERGVAQGDFAVWWAAHGLSYGLPVELIDEVHAGRVVVANLSRSILGESRRVFGNMRSVHITAHPDVLAARLASRGREAPVQQEARIRRSSLFRCSHPFDVEIDNSGPLTLAVDRFIATLNVHCQRQRQHA